MSRREKENHFESEREKGPATSADAQGSVKK